MKQSPDLCALEIGPFGARLCGYWRGDFGVREGEPNFAVPWEFGPDETADDEREEAA